MKPIPATVDGTSEFGWIDQKLSGCGGQRLAVSECPDGRASIRRTECRGSRLVPHRNYTFGSNCLFAKMELLMSQPVGLRQTFPVRPGCRKNPHNLPNSRAAHRPCDEIHAAHLRRVCRLHPYRFAAAHPGQVRWYGSAAVWRRSIRHGAFYCGSGNRTLAIDETPFPPTLIHPRATAGRPHGSEKTRCDSGEKADGCDRGQAAPWPLHSQGAKHPLVVHCVHRQQRHVSVIRLRQHRCSRDTPQVHATWEEVTMETLRDDAAPQKSTAAEPLQAALRKRGRLIHSDK